MWSGRKMARPMDHQGPVTTLRAQRVGSRADDACWFRASWKSAENADVPLPETDFELIAIALDLRARSSSTTDLGRRGHRSPSRSASHLRRGQQGDAASRHSPAAALRTNFARERKKAQQGASKTRPAASDFRSLAWKSDRSAAADGALPSTSTTETTTPTSTLPHDSLSPCLLVGLFNEDLEAGSGEDRPPRAVAAVGRQGECCVDRA